jgi:hypothetical protein
MNGRAPAITSKKKFIYAQRVIQALHKKTAQDYLLSLVFQKLLTPSAGHTYLKYSKHWGSVKTGETGSPLFS